MMQEYSKWLCVWMLLFMFASSLQWWSSEAEGCLEQERFALLQLKHSFHSSYSLQNWVERDNNSDCCQWDRIECNNTTGRVTSLDLSNTRDWGFFDLNASFTNASLWYLNASLFSPFKELELLDLRSNWIAGCVENEGLDRLARLSNLEFLDLSGNNFINGNSILSSLAGVSSLKALYLNDTGLNGTVDIRGLLDSLINLEVLDMSYNQIDKFVFPKGVKKLKALFLNNMNPYGSGLVLNTNGSRLLQSLEPLQSLKSLYLMSNDFIGGVTIRGLQNWTNLEELFLDYSSIDTSISQTIGALTSLKHLSMHNCELIGILPVHQVFVGLSKLKNLESLWLDGIALDSSSLQIIGHMTSLKILSLSSSNFTFEGTMLSGLCDLVHLQKLDLSYNYPKGSLPWCIANLTSLQVLDISGNQFTGNISSSPLNALTSIRDLILSYNHFRIPISLEPFFNHSKLKNVYGEDNEIYTDTESSSLIPKFQLNSFILPGYGDGVTFPKFLYHQHELEVVDLSHLKLRGQFPNWLLHNNTKLKRLHIANNSLSGAFELPIHSHMNLQKLDISTNFFQNHIPVEVGAYLPKLEVLNVSRNDFNGSIPSSIGDMKSLRSLYLSNNHLSGEIPQHLTMGCFLLEELVLSNNSLHGQIFSACFNLTNLLRLKLDGNNFTGKIPDSLSNCSLTGLYLSDNHLSGEIPKWLGNMSNLVDIIIPNNHLEGPIPAQFCQLYSLEVLDLSNNNIFGSLPSCFSPLSITQVHLSRNRLQGEVNGAFRNSSSLVTLDLGYNHFKGSIPSWIGELYSLNYLILNNNNFNGEVPVQLCRMDELRLIDLSHNNLSGQIPPCLVITAVPASNSFPTDDYAIVAVAPGPPPMRKEESVEFTTKNMSYSYQGRILTYMSGIDLSCNKLTGKIPPQIGNLTGVHTLNLSHNNLTGPIPSTFSNLNEIESLDLSYNNLNGKIPPLVELHYLEVFSVAHNNLSGKTPEMTAQFATFGAGSYEGNPLLCGPPLPTNCSTTGSSSSMPRASTDHEENSDGFIDMDIFYISFIVAYIIVLLGIAIVLYINPYWRRTWFYLVETWMTSCYYFVVDHL